MKYKILLGFFMVSFLSLPCKGMKKANADGPSEKEKQKGCCRAPHHKITPLPGPQEMSQIKIIRDPHQQPESLKWIHLIPSPPSPIKINFGNENEMIDKKDPLQVRSNSPLKGLVWVHTLPLPSQPQETTVTKKDGKRKDETITFADSSFLERDGIFSSEVPFLSSRTSPKSLSERDFETPLNDIQTSGITPIKNNFKENALLRPVSSPEEKEDRFQFLEKQLENERIYSSHLNNKLEDEIIYSQFLEEKVANLEKKLEEEKIYNGGLEQELENQDEVIRSLKKLQKRRKTKPTSPQIRKITTYKNLSSFRAKKRGFTPSVLS